MIKVTTFAMAAILSMSGQMLRKEIKEVPSTNVAEENVVQEVPKEQKSAARRSMEDNGETTLMRKSAAKRAMEIEESRG